METLALLESVRAIPDPDRLASATLTPIRWIRRYGAPLPDYVDRLGTVQRVRVAGGDGKVSGNRYQRLQCVPVVRKKADGGEYSPNGKNAVLTHDGTIARALPRRQSRMWRPTVWGSGAYARTTWTLDDFDEDKRTTTKGLYLGDVMAPIPAKYDHNGLRLPISPGRELPRENNRRRP